MVILNLVQRERFDSDNNAMEEREKIDADTEFRQKGDRTED